LGVAGVRGLETDEVEKQPEYVLRFKGTRQPTSEVNRLRRLLKHMLRTFGFVAQEVWEVKDADSSAEPVVRVEEEFGRNHR
jgi:hypothetical protein